MEDLYICIGLKQAPPSELLMLIMSYFYNIKSFHPKSLYVWSLLNEIEYPSQMRNTVLSRLFGFHQNCWQALKQTFKNPSIYKTVAFSRQKHIQQWETRLNDVVHSISISHRRTRDYSTSPENCRHLHSRFPSGHRCRH